MITPPGTTERFARLYAESLVRSETLSVECDDGAGAWHDASGNADACEAGDYLVDRGLWERKEVGYHGRWFYRPIGDRPRT